MSPFGIRRRFQALNPYTTIPGSVLKIEAENYDPATGEQREIECYAIASKRYGILTRTRRPPSPRPQRRQTPPIRTRPRTLLPPYAQDPSDTDPHWLDEWWQHLLCVELGYPSTPPDWFPAPAVGRLTITSPRDLKPCKQYNASRDRAQQIKPGNFLILAHPQPHERARPDGPRCLIAPFERNAARRVELDWLDRDRPDEPLRRIRTEAPHEIRDDSIAVLSYNDYFDNYRLHPETKALDPADNQPCHPWTRGLLAPPHITATCLNHIGKESNRLAEYQQTADDEDEQVIEYLASGRKCRGCDATVTGRRQWCEDACRKRSARTQRNSTGTRPRSPADRCG